jgi:(E)-4-hydroxy-3-methylbut-2-enyl-diphosphate synthase
MLVQLDTGGTGEFPAIEYPRRPTRAVRVGPITIGGGAPIVVQSMITEDTRDIPACVAAIRRLAEAGCELVRVTAPSMRDAYAIGEIQAELKRQGMTVPLVADVHHEGTQIAQEVARHVDKVRINPGLFVFRKRSAGFEYTEAEIAEAKATIEAQLLPVIQVCKERDIAMRIGVNHGSLSDRLTVMYGDTPEGMVQSALEFVEICERHDYRNLVISLKASRASVMIQANRLMARRMAERGTEYPLHLGVTEAGDGDYARIKSTAGIATLLSEGIGDTIRVSLAEDPIHEIPVCYDILQALGLRRTKTEFIACPSCGRTKFDLPTVLNQVRQATSHLKGLNIAVMGCFPPGERVITEQGFTPIESVTAGTRVLTHEGGFSPVAAVESHHFEGQLVEIKPRGALLVRMTPNHPILALVREGRVKGGRRRWANAAEIPGDHKTPRWYAADQVTTDFVMLYPVIQGEQVVDRVPEAPEVKMDDDFLRIAACYTAEGSVGGLNRTPCGLYLSFGLHEAVLAAQAAAILSGLGARARVREYPERHVRQAFAYCTRLACFFASLFGRRAENKRLPPWMLTLPRSQQAVLLQTLWQCDGYVGVVQGYPRATYVTVSPALAYQVHQLLLRQGITATMLEQHPANKQTVYYVSVTNADALRGLAAVLDRPISIPDGRARTARLALDDQYLYLPVQSVGRSPYDGPVHNLEVTRAHTYVASLCLVSNCIVNGPGEMADADYGYVGKGQGQISLYRGREIVKNMVPAERGVEELIALIKGDGRWEEP